MTTDTDLPAAVAQIKNRTPIGAVWTEDDLCAPFASNLYPFIATILNAVASGDLVPRAELDAARGRVKPLEWREVNDGNRRKGEVFGTRSPVSFAPITAHKKHDGWWLSADCKTYPTLEAAKAAAQADYAARILAALEPDPTMVRMREALEEIARQKRTDELETELTAEHADFEGGYDACIDCARIALTDD